MMIGSSRSAHRDLSINNSTLFKERKTMSRNKCGCNINRNICPKHRNRTVLKFSGSLLFQTTPGTSTAFLADPGTGITASAFPINYPISSTQTFTELAVHVDPATPVPAGSSIKFLLVQNGGIVPGFEIVFGDGGPQSAGVQLVTAGPVTFNPKDVLDLVAQETGLFPVATRVSATLS
jgi:hypothetical protein